MNWGLQNISLWGVNVAKERGFRALNLATSPFSVKVHSQRLDFVMEYLPQGLAKKIVFSLRWTRTRIIFTWESCNTRFSRYKGRKVIAKFCLYFLTIHSSKIFCTFHATLFFLWELYCLVRYSCFLWPFSKVKICCFQSLLFELFLTLTATTNFEFDFWNSWFLAAVANIFFCLCIICLLSILNENTMHLI